MRNERSAGSRVGGFPRIEVRSGIGNARPRERKTYAIVCGVKTGKMPIKKYLDEPTPRPLKFEKCKVWKPFLQRPVEEGSPISRGPRDLSRDSSLHGLSLIRRAMARRTLEHMNHPATKRGQIDVLRAGHRFGLDHDIFVDPIGAGISEIRLQ